MARLTERANDNPFLPQMDPLHIELGQYIEDHIDEPTFALIRDVSRDKYLQPGETFSDMAARVCEAIYQHDKSENQIGAYHAMMARLWMPAGRILAGAGTAKRVTLMNCYVTGTIEDSMEGILREHNNFALTMQQGGGDGMDCSPIRPDGAILKRTGTKASGPIPFLHMWNSMCETIRSAGDRRGAMMVTMIDTHPDLVKYITAKHVKGALKNFNMSILVSDAFMEAIAEDETWLLYFHIDTVEQRPDELRELDFVDDDGVTQYVYSKWRARDLWDIITQSTYEYSEPGVIFIDRVNDLNNLYYVEQIRATNPCGEQPLPPHGACDLGHANLARMVLNPFTPMARFNWDLLREIVRIGIRFLDNVIDVTNYPLEEQRLEQYNKRRIGLGFTGLADALVQMNMRYGSHAAQEFAERVEQFIQVESYKVSADLAIEKGPFPLFDADKWLSGKGVAGKLSNGLAEQIRKTGIRNSVLNSLAPTGTTSIAYYNPAGGLEPFLAINMRRKVRQADDSFKQYNNMNYAMMLYMFWKGTPLEENVSDDYFPSAFVATADLDIHDHVFMQSRVQRYVDASVSKTINIPKDYPYEQFVRVYDLAYGAGCKGCTTYRPSDVRGSILEDVRAGDVSAVPATAAPDVELSPRPRILRGVTHQIKWPHAGAAYYLTINFDEATLKPYEMFITSKDGSHSEWTTALSLMITAIFRKGGDASFVSQELKQIQSYKEYTFDDGKFVGSLPAMIGRILETHLTPG
jgi:ribonucleoside-diphosphate reductase alpha chain